MPVMACAVLLIALASPAAAHQSEACVHLQVGSGYAATMTVDFGDRVGPSDSFVVGQTQCLSLDPVADGEQFDVTVQALAGESMLCNPGTLTRSAALQAPILFNASGTTLNVHCDAPTGATRPAPKPPK